MHEHIVLTVSSHISYLLFDDVLNSRYNQDDSNDDDANNDPKKELVAVMIIEEDIDMENSKKGCLIHYLCVQQKLQDLGYGSILMNIVFQGERWNNKRVVTVSAPSSNYDTNIL